MSDVKNLFEDPVALDATVVSEWVRRFHGTPPKSKLF
jgi:hypothetical protein